MIKFFKDFKAFLIKGNVMDLAVGVVMGAAFGKITSSLVGDIIMPIISLITGSADVTEWKWVIQQAVYDGAGTLVSAEVAIRYGNLIQAIIDFIIIGFVVFLILRAFNKAKKLADEQDKKLEELMAKNKKEAPAPAAAPAPAPAPAPSNEEKLLIEIRDLLKKQQKGK